MAYPTLSEFKTWLDSSATDDAIQQSLDAGIAFVERFTGRVFVAVTATKYFPVEVPYVVGRRLYVHEDLASVTSITNGNGETVDSADYYLYPHSAPYHRIELRSNKLITWQATDDTENRIAVAGTWGYSSACPDDVYVWILRTAQHMLMARQTGTAGVQQVGSRQTGIVMTAANLDNDIIHGLKQYRRWSG